MKSAMSEALGDKNFQPTEKLIHLYERWAKGGIGLLVSGNVMVDRQHRSEPGNVVVDEKTDKAMLSRWAKAGTQEGTRFIMQLNHPGKQAPKYMQKEPLAPSSIPMPSNMQAFFNTPRAMTQEEIQKAVQQFVNAGKIAKESGFHGVQIHAAHGYLVNQFLSPADNQRTDAYGGSLENRMRFLLEIYQGLREALGKDSIIGIKLNSSDFTEKGFSEEDSLQVIQRLDALGIDFIEVSGGNYEKPKVASTEGGIFFLDFAKKAQAQVATPIVLTGGFTKLESMENALQEGIQMLGIARALVLAPELPKKIAEGSAIPVQLPRLHTGLVSIDKTIGGLLGIAYYEQQMERLGKGLDAKYSTNAWSPLLSLTWKSGLQALLPRRA